MAAAPFDPLEPAAQRELRELATAAARAGGAVARQHFREKVAIRLKADHSEVSAADEAAQAVIVAHLHAARPTDAFITEETLAVSGGSPPPSNASVCWLIDPIDGTRNYVRGIPVYATSVAAMFSGFPVAGAIYVPPIDSLYSGSRAEGLFVDGVPRQPRPLPVVGGIKLNAVVGMPSQPVAALAGLVHDWLGRFVCRNLGTTALHLALLATGELDAVLADIPRLWDIAAGWVLCEAAGMRATSPAGAPLFPVDVASYRDQKMPILAARPELYERVRQPTGPRSVQQT